MIENVEILAVASACDCEAGEVGNGQRVRTLCTYPCSLATVMFLTEAGVGKLTAHLRHHSLAHPGGSGPLKGRDINGYVNLCDTCCLFGKQVRIDSERSPRQ